MPVSNFRLAAVSGLSVAVGTSTDSAVQRPHGHREHRPPIVDSRPTRRAMAFREPALGRGERDLRLARRERPQRRVSQKADAGTPALPPPAVSESIRAAKPWLAGPNIVLP